MRPCCLGMSYPRARKTKTAPSSPHPRHLEPVRLRRHPVPSRGEPQPGPCSLWLADQNQGFQIVHRIVSHLHPSAVGNVGSRIGDMDRLLSERHDAVIRGGRSSPPGTRAWLTSGHISSSAAAGPGEVRRGKQGLFTSSCSRADVSRDNALSFLSMNLARLASSATQLSPIRR
jgi:hypothetical protein